MKVIIGRELAYAKTALIAVNPTRYLDELTSINVRRTIKEKSSREKVAVLYVSEDIEEALQVSNIIYIMSTGKLYGPFNPYDTPRSELEKLMVM